MPAVMASGMGPPALVPGRGVEGGQTRSGRETAVGPSSRRIRNSIRVRQHNRGHQDRSGLAIDCHYVDCACKATIRSARSRSIRSPPTTCLGCWSRSGTAFPETASAGPGPHRGGAGRARARGHIPTRQGQPGAMEGPSGKCCPSRKSSAVGTTRRCPTPDCPRSWRGSPRLDRHSITGVAIHYPDRDQNRETSGHDVRRGQFRQGGLDKSRGRE